MPNSSWWWFTRECATLSRVRLLYAASIRLSKRIASTLVELPQALAGRDCRLFFERDPLLSRLERGLFVWAGQRPSLHNSYCYLHSSCIFLWHNFATERFYIRVFLLDNVPVTANEHYQSE